MARALSRLRHQAGTRWAGIIGRLTSPGHATGRQALTSSRQLGGSASAMASRPPPRPVLDGTPAGQRVVIVRPASLGRVTHACKRWVLYVFCRGIRSRSASDGDGDGKADPPGRDAPPCRRLRHPCSGWPESPGPVAGADGPRRSCATTDGLTPATLLGGPPTQRVWGRRSTRLPIIPRHPSDALVGRPQGVQPRRAGPGPGD